MILKGKATLHLLGKAENQTSKIAFVVNLNLPFPLGYVESGGASALLLKGFDLALNSKKGQK